VEIDFLVSLALLSRYCFEEFNCLNHKRLRQEAAANTNTKHKHFEGHNKEEQVQPKGVQSLES